MKKIAVLWPNALYNKEKICNLDVVIFENVGALNAAETALKAKEMGAEAIICTSGTIDEVRRVTNLPVHVVTASYMDVLETIKMLEKDLRITGKRVALLLHKANPLDASRLQPYTSNRLEKFVFAFPDEIPFLLNDIQKQGFDVVLVGPSGVMYAKDLDITIYQYRYSQESVLEAVERVEFLLQLVDKEYVQMQRLQAAIDASPYAMLVTDETGKIDLCNSEVERVFNKTKGEILGTSMVELLGNDDCKRSIEQNREIVNSLLTVGKESYFYDCYPIVKEGKTVGSVGMLQEVEQIRRKENRYRTLQTKGLTAKYHFADIVCQSDKMKRTIALAEAYASTNLTVLIEGETGTGKELFAQSIHNASARKYEPFVAVNCAALSESLLESELMGYEEGAFTGAKKGGKIGLFELAHNGTIFLDEINQMPIALQSKVLRVIQEHSVLRLGGDRIIPVDVRIIAATNERLADCVEKQKFRNDLYYRLNILNLNLPPLRERREDISLLAKAFSKEMQMNDDIRELMEQMGGYSWPGNVRELQNFVWRNVTLLACGIQLDVLKNLERKAESAETAAKESATPLLKGTLAEIEREIFAQTLLECDGNYTRAAKKLGITRNTLRNRLQEK